MINGNTGLNSEDENESISAVNTISCLIEFNSKRLFYHILSALITKLNNAEIEKLTESDILIYNTPDGILSSEMQKQHVHLSAEDEKKLRKKEKQRIEKKSKRDKVPFGEDQISDSDSETEGASHSGHQQQKVRASISAAQAQTKDKHKKKTHNDAAEKESQYKLKLLFEESQVIKLYIHKNKFII